MSSKDIYGGKESQNRDIMKRESEKIRRKLMTVALVLAIILGTGILAYNVDNLYLNSRHNIMSYLPETVFIDGNNSGFVRVLEPDGSAAAGQRIRLWASEAGGERRLIWEGKTDDTGEAHPSFRVPDMNCTSIIIDTGQESIERTVRTDSHLQIYISTDKPLYKPGQTVHIRVLALNKNAGPYEGQITLEVSAPSGDAIFRSILNTSRFGTASMDFPLAPILPLGAYKISADLLNGDGNSIKANKIFTVADYVLPKFNIDIIGLQSWYAPNIPIHGTVTCDYMFGKHVSGIASVDLMTYDGSWTRRWSTQSSLRDGEYAFNVPENTISDISRERGISYISLNATVTDESGHTESDSKLLPFSRDVISITTIGDQNYLGLNSTYHFVLRYPDGSPVPYGKITVKGSSYNSHDTTIYTDERGVASYTFTYTGDYFIHVTASKGDYVTDTYYNLQSLRTDIKAVADKNRYSVGEEAFFDVFYNGEDMSDWFYYEASQNGVVISSGKGQLSSGHATVAIPITAELAPVGSFSVYKINENGEVQSYSTAFGVDYSMPLSISVNTDKDIYKPKDDARINFHVENASGGVASALGVSIIDSAVMEMMQRMSGQTGFDEVERAINGEVNTPRDMLYNYVYADAGPLPSESDTLYDGKDTNISMTSNWQSVLLNAHNYRSEAISAYWNLITSLSIIGFVGLAYLSLKKSPEKEDRVKRKRIIIVVLVIAVVLISVIAGAVLYVMVIGMSGSSSLGTMGPDDGMAPPSKTGFNDLPNEAPVCLTQESAAESGDSVHGAPDASNGGGNPEPKEDVRQYFPETWYWNPTLITNENGDANLSVSAPDSITTWLLRAVASDKNGELGYTQSNITVFKEFFIEPDLPASVVAGDIFRLRVMAYNYNSTPANITISLTPASWFSTDNGAIKEISVPANSVRSCYFNIKVGEEAGLHHITVSGNNRHSIDTVSREIKVAPYGKKVYDVRNGELLDSNYSTEMFALQDGRVPGGDQGYVVMQGISEGVALEGAENFIGYVSGCGEQSMSRLSVDILAFNLIKNKEGGDENMMKDESMVVQGIQHELTFLVDGDGGRGIVWFPSDSSPHPWLTSWGLITFQDAIDAGFTIDPKIIKDMQDWLVKQQNSDGSFAFPEEGLYETTNPILRSKEIATTAYITRALLYSGMDPHDTHIEHAAKYIEANIDDVWDDPYSLSICLIALNRADYSSSLQADIASRIDAMKITENKTVHWESQTSMISDSYNRYSSARTVETTGYAVLALNTQGYLFDVREGIQYLIGSRSERGLFSSTQDTVVALQAIIHASHTWKVGSTLNVTVFVSNTPVKNLTITQKNADITYMVDITPYLSDRFEVSLKTSGAGSIYYRVVVSQVIPWNVVPEEKNELELTVGYSALSVSLYDSVTADMKLTYTGSAPEMKMALVHLECPAGMEFYPSEFSEFVNRGIISYYEIQDHSIDIYLENIKANSPITLEYTLTAINTGTYTIQGIHAYDMYEPDNRVEVEPVTFQILE